MTIYTCNDHKDAAVCFVGHDCPLCVAIDYHEEVEVRINNLLSEVDSLQSEIESLKEEK